MMSENNPYAAPADVQTIVDVNGGVMFFRDGRFLVVRDGAVLPETCVVTNEPAESGSWRKQVKIAWTPPWVYLLILVNIIVLLIVSMIVQKKARITYSVGRRGRRKIVLRRWIASLLLMLSVALFFFGAMADTDEMVGIGITAGFASLIASLIFFVIANPLKVVKFKNDWFRIKGCAPDFLDTLPQHLSPF